MTSRARSGRVLALILLALALAATARAETVASAYRTADGLGFDVQPAYVNADLALTVSGPQGIFFVKSFPAGSRPVFSAREVGLAALPAGQYAYELTVRPRVSEEALAARALELEEGRAAGHSGPQGLIQAGSFRVQDSQDYFAAASAEPVGTQAQFVEDIYVTGSLCVGFDCVNGTSFGFDTIVLRENNLRILFDDTSASAGFPARDWRIVVNDTINGGTEYFGIEDSNSSNMVFKVMGGAPANSVFVDASGRLGLRTSTPAMELHLRDTDTPTMRLEQDGTGGWAPQTWDVAGNEANFFVRDVTNGSLLPFRIRPGAPTSSLDIAASGYVGIGTATPAKTLDVNGDAVIHGSLEIGSSRELKDDIRPIGTTEALRALRAMRPVTYRYKSDPAEACAGFVAEDVPDLVATNGRKTLNPMDFAAVLTRVAQEQQRVIEEQQARLDVQARAIAALAERLARMEQAAAAAGPAALARQASY